MRRPLLVMGVAGSGKSTLAAAIAARAGAPFIEADELHPPSNRSKMAGGVPLDDADRWPWLDAVAAAMAASPGCIVACSALKRAYRDRLRVAAPFDLVFLEIDADAARDRLEHRMGHYMPSALAESQFAALEPPGEAEHPLVLIAAMPLDDAVERVLDSWATWCPAPK